MESVYTTRKPPAALGPIASVANASAAASQCAVVDAFRSRQDHRPWKYVRSVGDSPPNPAAHASVAAKCTTVLGAGGKKDATPLSAGIAAAHQWRSTNSSVLNGTMSEPEGAWATRCKVCRKVRPPGMTAATACSAPASDLACRGRHDRPSTAAIASATATDSLAHRDGVMATVPARVSMVKPRNERTVSGLPSSRNFASFRTKPLRRSRSRTTSRCRAAAGAGATKSISSMYGSTKIPSDMSVSVMTTRALAMWSALATAPMGRRVLASCRLRTVWTSRWTSRAGMGSCRNAFAMSSLARRMG
jgi:hypothetical protein